MIARGGPRAKTGGRGPRVNSALTRRINAPRLFHIIRLNPGISQRRLSIEADIDPATVSIIINNFEQAGIVRRVVDPPTGRAGRPTSALTLDPRSYLSAGIGIEPDTIRIVLAAIDGTVRADLAVEGSTDPLVARRSARSGLITALRSIRARQSDLIGIGIALPGLVGLAHTVVFAPNLGWHEVDFVAGLKVGSCPVWIENDVKAAALAEHLFGASRDVSDFIYVLGRSGIGAGLYVGGELYRGVNGLAGEIGHMKIVPDGRACACGGKGCFEAYASERAIITELAERGQAMHDLDAVVAAAEAGYPPVIQVLEEAGAHLGLALANVMNMMSPQRVVLGGGLARLAPFLLPAARDRIGRDALEPIRRDVEIAISGLGERAAAMGGVALALQKFLDEPPAKQAASRR